ncbi:cytochrome P450 [Aspergillus falconensis]
MIEPIARTTDEDIVDLEPHRREEEARVQTQPDDDQGNQRRGDGRTPPCWLGLYRLRTAARRPGGRSAIIVAMALEPALSLPPATLTAGGRPWLPRAGWQHMRTSSDSIRCPNTPGPPLAAVSELWYASAWTGGIFWNRKIQEAHRRYGDIVRIAPNELSFATAQAFRDIYGVPSKTRKLFPKSDRFYDNGHPNIALVLDPEEHPIVHAHADLWVAQIAARGRNGAVPLDVSKWLEWLTFDIIGELTFGESFNATRDNKSHPWVSILLDATYSGSIFNLRKRRRVHHPARRHGAMTLALTRKRIEAGPARSDVDDFRAHAIRASRMSDTELADQAMILLTAGAETSATALTAALWYLSRPAHAHCLERLRTEMRGAFVSPADVDAVGVSRRLGGGGGEAQAALGKRRR